MKDREHEIQVECVRWFRMRFRDEIIYAIPNGGQRNVVVAAKMKAEGVTAGVPDLFVAAMRGGYGGLYVEMKKSRVGKRGELVDKGTLSDAQREMIPRLIKKGYKVAVCYCFDDFKDECERYFAIEN